MRALVSSLKEKDIPYRSDVAAALLCTFRIGGTAALVIEPRCEGELLEALALCRAARVPFEILGNGSNVMFEDGYLRLAVIRTKGIDQCRVFRGGILAGCGVMLPRISRLAAEHGLGGLEFACGIPGTLGGALVMNAGAHGKQISELVKYVKILDLDTNKIKTDFDFKKNALYRNGENKRENVLFLSAELALEEGVDPEVLHARIRCLNAQRNASQPIDLPSAGCAFKRLQAEAPIGKFLDELGCKGMRVGGAMVSPKHAAFIVNTGGAKAADVKELMRKIQNKAEKERGMIPESEIRIISDRT